MSNKRRTQNLADSHFFLYKLGIDVPPDVTHVLVHHSVEVLPEEVFAECEHLKEVKIEEGLREIGAAAFRNCVSLEYVTLPSTLKKICEFAVCWCKSLKEIILPEGLTEIGDRGFRECTSLKHICVPSTVATIGDEAFYGCTSLKVVRLVDGIRTIGEAAFLECNSLDDIMLPDTLTAIYKCAFTAGFWGGNSLTPQRGTFCDGILAVGAVTLTAIYKCAFTAGSWGGNSLTPRRVTFCDGILAVGAEVSPQYSEFVVISSKSFVISKIEGHRQLPYSFQFVTEGTIPETDSGQVVIASEGFNLLHPADMPEVERVIARILGRSMLLGWNEKRERLLALVAPYEVRYKKERTTLLKLGLWKKMDANGAAFIVPQVLSYL